MTPLGITRPSVLETPRAVGPVAHGLPIQGQERSWTSPAFLKRKHLEPDSFLGSVGDPFADQAQLGDSPSKRPKFGRPSDQWRYTDGLSSPKENRVHARIHQFEHDVTSEQQDIVQGQETSASDARHLAPEKVQAAPQPSHATLFAPKFPGRPPAKTSAERRPILEPDTPSFDQLDGSDQRTTANEGASPQYIDFHFSDCYPVFQTPRAYTNDRQNDSGDLLPLISDSQTESFPISLTAQISIFDPSTSLDVPQAIENDHRRLGALHRSDETQVAGDEDALRNESATHPVTDHSNLVHHSAKASAHRFPEGGVTDDRLGVVQSPIVGSSPVKPVEIIDLDSDDTSTDSPDVEDETWAQTKQSFGRRSVDNTTGYEDSSRTGREDFQDLVRDDETSDVDIQLHPPEVFVSSPNYFEGSFNHEVSDKHGIRPLQGVDSQHRGLEEKQAEDAAVEIGSNPIDLTAEKQTFPATLTPQASGHENDSKQSAMLEQPVEKRHQSLPNEAGGPLQLETPLATQVEKIDSELISSSSNVQARQAQQDGRVLAEDEELQAGSSAAFDRQNNISPRTLTTAFRMGQGSSKPTQKGRIDLGSSPVPEIPPSPGVSDEVDGNELRLSRHAAETPLTPPPSLPQPASQPQEAAQPFTPSSARRSARLVTSPVALPRSVAPPVHGIRTPISYYTPLAALTQHRTRSVDVLGLCVAATLAARAPRGPRDHHQTLFLLDPSVLATTSASKDPDMVSAQVFRPHRAALPAPAPGAVVLLRDFSAVARGGKFGLVTGEGSAWAVFAPGSGAEAVVRGPPVEYGEEELELVRALRDWWDGVDASLKERLGARVAKETRIQGKESGSKATQTSSKKKKDVAGATGMHSGSPAQERKLRHELRNGRKYSSQPPSTAE